MKLKAIREIKERAVNLTREISAKEGFADWNIGLTITALTAMKRTNYTYRRYNKTLSTAFFAPEQQISLPSRYVVGDAGYMKLRREDSYTYLTLSRKGRSEQRVIIQLFDSGYDKVI